MLGCISILPQMGIYAQSNSTPITQQDVQETAQQTAQDTTLPVAGGTVLTTAIAAAGLYLNDRRETKKLQTKMTLTQEEETEKRKQIDQILQDINIVLWKIFYAGYIYTNKNFRQILDLKSTNNPLEKNTLGEEYAILINKLTKLTNAQYDLPQPNMSIASPQVIQATTLVAENKATTPNPDPVPAADPTPPAPQQGSQ